MPRNESKRAARNARVGRTLLSATRSRAGVDPIHIHEHEPRRIPNLVDACASKALKIYGLELRVRRKNDASAPPMEASATAISIQKNKLTANPIGVNRLWMLA